ncbi:MAG: two-component system sensor histidine kinase NtrB [Methermicoccaceae archaeon]
MVLDERWDEGWYRLLFEGAGEAIIVVQNDRVVDANPKACMLLGRPREDIVSAHINELFSNATTSLPTLTSMLVENGSACGEAVLLNTSGEGVLVSISASKVSDDVSLFMLRNVGEREEMERKLVQAEKMAALGRLSAAIAHEINNPLTGITNYLALLKNHTHDRELSRFIRPIEREVERISGLVRGLLEFYQPKQMVREVCINDVVEDVLSLLSDSLKMHNIRVLKRLDRSVPPIMVSVDQMRHVLINLVVNSIDAIGEDGQIHVSTSHDERSVVLRVRDTGCGIPEEVLPYVFEPFFSTKHKTTGTGLGLFVSYGIVKELGGRIEVKSEHGKGTEFSLTFPKLTPKAEPTRTRTS